MCRNSHFKIPLRDEFFREVREAVRFEKQKSRNVVKIINKKERGRRQRMRHEADNNLLSELQNNAQAVDTDNADDSDEESS